MAKNRQSAQVCRASMRPLLLAACWIACMPMEAGAQAAANLSTELVNRVESVSNGDCGLASEPLAQRFGTKIQASAPAPSSHPQTPAARRDSIKNGLLIGAAVGAVVSVLASRIADCPDSAEGSCPGTKALGIAITVATGAAIGAGIDLLFAVDPAPGRVRPIGARRGIVVSGRIRW